MEMSAKTRRPDTMGVYKTACRASLSRSYFVSSPYSTSRQI